MVRRHSQLVVKIERVSWMTNVYADVIDRHILAAGKSDAARLYAKGAADDISRSI
jgi:hypothetical protein